MRPRRCNRLATQAQFGLTQPTTAIVSPRAQLFDAMLRDDRDALGGQRDEAVVAQLHFPRRESITRRIAASSALQTAVGWRNAKDGNSRGRRRCWVIVAKLIHRGEA